MKKSKKMMSIMAAVFLICCTMRWHTAYASSTSSQLQPADTTAVSVDGDANADMSVQETSDTGTLVSGVSDQYTGGSSSDESDQNEDGQSTGTSDSNTDGQSADSSGQNIDGQPTDPAEQDASGQSVESSKQDMDEQTSGESQSNDTGSDEDQSGEEDDDEWADGDDEWTDAWTGVDDDIGDGEWVDDGDKSGEAGITSADSRDPYDEDNKYTAVSTISNISSGGDRNALDQNYQTGAGLGNDIFLLLAVVCGIVAIGLAARKNSRHFR